MHLIIPASTSTLRAAYQRDQLHPIVGAIALLRMNLSLPPWKRSSFKSKNHRILVYGAEGIEYVVIEQIRGRIKKFNPATSCCQAEVAIFTTSASIKGSLILESTCACLFARGAC